MLEQCNIEFEASKSPKPSAAMASLFRGKYYLNFYSKSYREDLGSSYNIVRKGVVLTDKFWMNTQESFT